MTGCLSDSSRICQSPSTEATGKLNASKQGHSYTFPWCTQSGILALLRTQAVRTWDTQVPGLPPSRVTTTQCFLSIS
jgi:hypothetical protein